MLEILQKVLYDYKKRMGGLSWRKTLFKKAI